MRSFVSGLRKSRWTSPPKTPDTPLPRLRFIGSCPKCEKRLAAIHPSPPAHIAARDERRRSPAERTSALRSLFAPRACRCSFSQSKRYAAATTACLLPRAISPPMLTALCFCLASADYPQIVFVYCDAASSSQTSPTFWPTCQCRVRDPLSCMSTAFAHSVWNWGEDTPPSHRCATSTAM